MCNNLGLGPEVCSELFLIVSPKTNERYTAVSIIVTKFTGITTILSVLLEPAIYFPGQHKKIKYLAIAEIFN